MRHRSGMSYKSGITFNRQGPIKILHPGTLHSVGYDPDYKEAQRHRALGKAVKKYGYAETVRKLNAVRVLTKNSNQKYSKIYEKDLKWLRKKYGKKK